LKGYKKLFQANGMQKLIEVAILIFNKADYKPKLVRRDKKNHLMLTNGRIHQEAVIIVNVYIPNFKASN
jgi:hypothetical protein